MIKIGGINLAPLEAEQVLLKHPDIVQAYVVGIPEIVAAAVELRAPAECPNFRYRSLGTTLEFETTFLPQPEYNCATNSQPGRQS